MYGITTRIQTYIFSPNSSYSSTFSLSQDPEAHLCYSIKSRVLPEEIIDLNRRIDGQQNRSANLKSAKVTFDEVHSILYGQTSSGSVYDYANIHFNKTADNSYPHTYLKAEIFATIIKKIHPNIKVQLIVELGSFTGGSAIIMGRLVKMMYPNTLIMCIDTWLGGMYLKR